MTKLTKAEYMALPKISERLARLPVIDVVECKQDCDFERCQGWHLGDLELGV